MNEALLLPFAPCSSPSIAYPAVLVWLRLMILYTSVCVFVRCVFVLVGAETAVSDRGRGAQQVEAESRFTHYDRCLVPVAPSFGGARKEMLSYYCTAVQE